MNTGVQRVVRGLFRAWTALLGSEAVVPVLWEPRLRAYCTLSSRERGFLTAPFAGSTGRKSRAEPGRVANQVPVLSKWWRQVTHRRNQLDLVGMMTVEDTLFVPEIFQDNRVAWLSGLGGQCPARRIAVCHDAIGWRNPEMTLAARLAGFTGYLNSLRTFDGVLAVSQEASDDLQALWHKHDAAGPVPPVRVAGWPADEGFAVTSHSPSPNPLPQLLCVGTFEPRKNHLTLLSAAECLWSQGLRFELVLVGRTTVGWGVTVEREVERLRAAGRPVSWRRHVDDETLRGLYRDCLFTVFPSLAEGFGIPIVESLRHGRPCVCGGNGALGELSSGGGCLVVENQAEPGAMADGIRRLLTDGGLRGRLSEEARSRVFPTWQGYVRRLRPFVVAGPGSELDHHAERELRAEA